MAARKAVKQELTRSMIIDAARELFVNKGYQSVSMRQIADSLGYSHGALYYHFKNKAELFYAIVKEAFSQLDEGMDALLRAGGEGGDRLDTVQAILLGYIEFGMDHPSQYEMMFLSDNDEVRSYLADAPNRSYEKFASILNQLYDGKLSVTIIWSVFLSLHGFVARYYKQEQSYSEIAAMAKSHVQFIMKGISGD